MSSSSAVVDVGDQRADGAQLSLAHVLSDASPSASIDDIAIHHGLHHDWQSRPACSAVAAPPTAMATDSGKSVLIHLNGEPLEMWERNRTNFFLRLYGKLQGVRLDHPTAERDPDRPPECAVDSTSFCFTGR